MPAYDREREDLSDEREQTPGPVFTPTAGPLAMGELARKVGNQAMGRMLSRMSVIDAVNAAKTGGATEEEKEVNRLATEGQRFDPIGKVWVTPTDEKLWDTFYSMHTKLGAKFKLPFKVWEEKQLAKSGGDAKKGVDITDDQQLKALWGNAPVFEKWECAKAIAKLFTEAGFEVVGPWESKPEETSSKTPPVLFDVKGHKMISKFEIHPGGGIHKAAYIRISANAGMIKIIKSDSDPPYAPLGEKVLKYVWI